MNPHEPFIDRFRRRLALVLICKASLTLATLWAFLWGTLVLLLRATTDIPAAILLCGVIGLPVCVVAGVIIALRQMPSRQAVRAVIDRQNHLGGVLMATAEVDVRAGMVR